MRLWDRSIRGRIAAALWVAGGVIAVGWAQHPPGRPPANDTAQSKPAALKEFVADHCASCHNGNRKSGGLALDAISDDKIAAHAALGEKVVRKLTARQMPPVGHSRPDEREYQSAVATLEAALDRAAAADPNPGRTATFRRLNRTEYQNAIRDLLALEIDAAALLPNDETSHGFDSSTLGDLSPTLLDRYITAAQKVSRLAVGRTRRSAGSDTIRVPADLTQEERVDGLPLGTRGGILIRYTFPQHGEYEIQARLTRDRDEKVEGLRDSHDMVVLLDRKRVASFTVTPPANPAAHLTVDEKLKTRVAVTAGPHDLGVTFLKKPSSLLETKRQPYEAHYNVHRHPRPSPAIYQVTIIGPYDAKGHGDTPSRRRLFVTSPTGPADEEVCAKKNLAALMRRAYRRPITEADLEKPLRLYREARASGDFDAGMEMALSAVLVNPNFLFRVEHDPVGVAAKSSYRIGDLDLASRLSFFLWSSIPDDELLDLAARKELRKPDVFEKQVRRLLADDRARNLVTNFAAQWLYLRNLESITPELRLFPDFDDNLRKAFRQETELFFESVLREDRSVLDLLKADYTFLNQRLAKHYGIPHVYGDRFRRVTVAGVSDPGSERGGLLRHGSILTVTSYATRTSPVIRGKWILENVLGTPPPPPPADVPSLRENTVSASLPIRERLKEHRNNVACAGCHRLIDPVGFGLEEFDAVGRLRTAEDGKAIDATGGLPDGSEFVGVAGLEKALLQRPELFVRTLTEKLFTFALGRAPEEFDAPAIRKIVRDARADGYRFSSLIVGITTSAPFQMRRAE
jgi:mono/diheme cytochrome c family protein